MIYLLHCYSLEQLNSVYEYVIPLVQDSELGIDIVKDGLDPFWIQVFFPSYVHEDILRDFVSNFVFFIEGFFYDNEGFYRF